jgi:hypothetical protein
MWLGYGTASAAAWHPKAASEQGQFWKESWETAASNARTPIWGDWDRTAGVLTLNFEPDALSRLRKNSLFGRLVT